MAEKKKVKKVVQKYPRQLSDTEFEVRDLQWAAAVNCSCGYQHDVFIRYIEPEMACPKCGKKYEVRLVGYEIKR